MTETVIGAVIGATINAHVTEVIEPEIRVRDGESKE